MKFGNCALVIWKPNKKNGGTVKPIVVSRAFLDFDEIKRENDLWEHDVNYSRFIILNGLTPVFRLELLDKLGYYVYYPQLTAPDAPAITIFVPSFDKQFSVKANTIKLGRGKNGGIEVSLCTKEPGKCASLCKQDRIDIARQLCDVGGLDGT